MIQFIKCTSTQYAALTTKTDSFYYLTDTNKFYLKDIELSNQDLSNYLTSVSAKDDSIAVTNNSEIAVKLSAKSGNSLSLVTSSGEQGLYVNVPSQTDYTVTVSETSSEGYAKAYVLSQLGSEIGTINIPKDMVVSSGSVVTNPTGQPAGTYLVLTLANATSDKVYINVSDLIEYVTAGTDTSTVHVMISNDHKVTANVINASIGTTQLAAGVVTSLGKADSALQPGDIKATAAGGNDGTFTVGSTEIAIKGLGSAAYTNSSAYATSAEGTLATNAVRAVAAGSSNGTIKVTTGTGDPTDISVTGLKSAAFTNSSAYATAAQGTKADTAIQSIAQGDSNGQIKYSVDGSTYTAVSVKGLDTAAYAKTTDFDASGAAAAVLGTNADTASANTVYGAKAYAASLLEWQTLS